MNTKKIFLYFVVGRRRDGVHDSKATWWSVQRSIRSSPDTAHGRHTVADDSCMQLKIACFSAKKLSIHGNLYSLN